MSRIISVLVVLAAPLLLSARGSDDVAKELKALEGKWKAVEMEAGGQALPKNALPEFMFIVGPGGKATAKMAEREEQATMSVNPNKSPKTIDNLHGSGAHKGKTQYGIYKLEGDKWTVCMTQPGVVASDRPKDFTTKDTSNVVFVFERVK
jgi:uncharacterized protein (TIGR03067 family)